MTNDPETTHLPAHPSDPDIDRLERQAALEYRAGGPVIEGERTMPKIETTRCVPPADVRSMPWHWVCYDGVQMVPLEWRDGRWEHSYYTPGMTAEAAYRSGYRYVAPIEVPKVINHGG
jgi:hypothetical protein